jgi:ubiquinone/menaquinone biosynthesis C-methylase UbiE
MRQRAKVVPLAEGRVLEIGAGSGLNLPFYDARKVSRMWALDPSIEMWKMAGIAARRLAFPVEFMPAPAATIPLDDGSVDTVVTTYSLCTIPDVRVALAEMRRVLRSGGLLLFCEHGMAPDAGVRKWQDRMNGLWMVLGGGCHLNRDIPSMLRAGGFEIHTMDTMYLPGWKPAAFNYWGVAK